ncbi:DUF4099 domain-containing protein [Phocaeicola barnesiae]|jgi:hypothetical protein|uniref:DUF4099 domain-containing protein n=1 Tax=Phocaeicola barnesiae TaxID=376804 RepID=UPI0025A4AC18|nr:DUF4099 domain-containing protein [Phocaeicola barnesiae]MDM8242863.1 DUF4099 domain-containing protein [Phocaeicola barnesiae]
MNKKQDLFKENEIPYHDLKMVGIEKSDVLSFNRENLEALTSGKRTSLLSLRFTDRNGENFNFEGKISLYRKPDGVVGLMIHPVRNSILNDMNLKDKEIESLKAGKLVAKTVQGERFLVQLDKETNELLRANMKSIRIPSYIEGEKISREQKEALKNGESIFMKSGSEVRLDLNEKNGVKFLDFSQKQKIEFDRLNPGVVDTIQTDKNRQEYVEYERDLNKKTVNEKKELKFKF